MALKIAGETSIQLSDYLAVIARKKFVLFVSVVVGVALALGYSYGIASPAYSSQASVLVQPVLDRPFNPGTGGIDKSLNMGTEKTVATSTAVAQIVKDTLKLPDDVTVIAGRASAQTVGTTQLLVITYTDSTKLAAQRGAQAFAEAYLKFHAAEAAQPPAEALRRHRRRRRPPDRRDAGLLHRPARRPPPRRHRPRGPPRRPAPRQHPPHAAGPGAAGPGHHEPRRQPGRTGL